MRDGLYRVEFQTPLGAGAGIVVVNGSKLRGGDSSMYYVGSYSETGNQFTAEVVSHRHTLGFPSVFARDANHITLKGTSQGDRAEMTGTSKEEPGVTLRGTMTKIDE